MANLLSSLSSLLNNQQASDVDPSSSAGAPRPIVRINSILLLIEFFLII